MSTVTSLLGDAELAPLSAEGNVLIDMADLENEGDGATDLDVPKSGPPEETDAD